MHVRCSTVAIIIIIMIRIVKFCLLLAICNVFLSTTATDPELGKDKCENVIDFLNTNNSQHLTTSILLREECNISGAIQWRHSDQDTRQIVQFRRAKHQSFIICLILPATAQNSFTVHQLRGVSKKLIYSSSAEGLVRTGSPLCVQSQCSHVSLMLQQDKLITTNHHERDVTIKYQFALDQRCSKCTEQCMKNVFCNSDYMFIGTVIDNDDSSDDRNNYRSTVKLERIVKYNKTYETNSSIVPHPSCSKPTANQTQLLSANRRQIAVSLSDEVIVYSNSCQLKLMKRYLIAGNVRGGLKNKGRLTISCAQEDAEYSLYVLRKMMTTDQCC